MRWRRLSVVYSPRPEEVGREIDAARGVVVGREVSGPGTLLIDSSQASRRHSEISINAALGVARIVDLESKNGTYVDGEKIEDPTYLPSGSVIRVGDVLLVYSEFETPVGEEVRAEKGVSLARAWAEHLIDLAAPTEVPVLVLGPTGAGKERLAERFHAKSCRSGPLVAVNCAGIAPELFASELFGHVAGAFTGATAARSGLIASADGGTLFLDEVAELPMAVQASLLRTLQERVVRPVGSDRDKPVDVRVLSATSQDLEALESRGAFRSDLVGRLSGLRVTLPGLSARKEEILPLFDVFLGEQRKPLTLAAAERLLVHDWPKNVRELQHAAAGARLFVKAVPSIDVPLLPSQIQQAAEAPVTSKRPVSRDQLLTALREHGGNVAKISTSLGESRQRLYRLFESYGLDPASFRPKNE